MRFNCSWLIIYHPLNELALNCFQGLLGVEKKIMMSWISVLNVCASSFKWNSPITDIYKEILASHVVNIENHAPYSRKSRYAQSLLTLLICARSRISQIICDSLRVTEYPFATLMKKHYTLTWEEHPFLSPIPSPLFHLPFLFDACKGGYKVLGNNHIRTVILQKGVVGYP